jgi:16S rRNA (guanine527-N7)-methyltransferase
MTVAELEYALRRGAGELSLVLTDAQFAQLLDYLALLQKWGRVYNLTAVRDPGDMLTHHLLDSLAVIAPLHRQLGQSFVASPQVRLLDVGSGAGLPGVVIAICCPAVSVTCVDTVAKKAAFIQQVAASLRLPNLRGVHARVEKLTERYDVLVSRAFASLADFVNWSAGALAQGGFWLAMKGKQPADELAALPATIDVFHVEQLEVPGLDVQRCLVWMRPRTPS